MERYALNDTPLAGHATRWGRGAAVQDLAADGAGHLVMHPRAQAAGMAAHAQGDGLAAVLGNGAAHMSMTVAGRAYLLLCGIGDVAFMALSALADGAVIPAARGVASMAMTAVGDGIKAMLGTGSALFGLQATGRATMASNGSGSANLVMTASVGLPHPFVTPATFTAAHPSRVLKVGPDANAFVLAAQDRTIHVAPEPRTIHVLAERSR
jgi:hypothetical protein